MNAVRRLKTEIIASCYSSSVRKHKPNWDSFVCKMRFVFLSSVLFICLWGTDSRIIQDNHGRNQTIGENATYTLAIFKDQRPVSHTAAIFKPYENEIPNHLPHVYRPLLGPGQFTLVGQNDDDTREGEVIAIQEPINSDQLYQAENDYHTIDEISNSVNANTFDSYLPEESYDSISINFTGYPQSYYSVTTAGTDSAHQWHMKPVTGGDIVLEDSNTSVTVKLKNENANFGTHYYIGYKIWYSAVVFAIYQTIVTLVYLLTLLSKHYLVFPAALQAAAAASNENRRSGNVEF